MSGPADTVLDSPKLAIAACASVRIRALTTIAEFGRCVELQRAVWGWSDLDLMPVRLFVLGRQIGGLVLGAYDEDALIGFVNCVPGVSGGRHYWHSHMMAVLPEFQNRGIGTALKFAQRAHALDRGVSLIQWVFDPLQPRIAHFNLLKLGVVVRGYSVGHYGPSSSPLHAGRERDLVVAEWRLSGAPLQFSRAARRVRIPKDYQRLKQTNPALVQRIEQEVRAAFLEHLGHGFVATAFERDGDGWAYVLRRPLEDAPTVPHDHGG